MLAFLCYERTMFIYSKDYAILSEFDLFMMSFANSVTGQIGLIT